MVSDLALAMLQYPQMLSSQLKVTMCDCHGRMDAVLIAAA